jgi:hypothetical protein
MARGQAVIAVARDRLAPGHGQRARLSSTGRPVTAQLLHLMVQPQ